MCNIDDADNELLPSVQCRPVAAWPHRCDDCGRIIPVGERFNLTEWAEWWYPDDVEESLAKPVDHPRRRYMEAAGARRARRSRPFMFEPVWSDDFEVIFDPTTRYTDSVCDQCLAAALWLNHVCGGHIHGGAIEELAEHWAEDDTGESYRCVALGRLILSAQGRPNRQSTASNKPRVQPWHRLDGTLIPVATVERWVTEAIAAYERNTLAMLRDLSAA